MILYQFQLSYCIQLFFSCLHDLFGIFFQSPTGYCVACSKSFATEKAYENHLKSKKHLEALKAFEQKKDKDEIAKNRRNRKLTEETAAEETMEEDADSADEDYEEVIFLGASV